MEILKFGLLKSRKLIYSLPAIISCVFLLFLGFNNKKYLIFPILISVLLILIVFAVSINKYVALKDNHIKIKDGLNRYIINYTAISELAKENVYSRGTSLKIEYNKISGKGIVYLGINDYGVENIIKCVNIITEKNRELSKPDFE